MKGKDHSLLPTPLMHTGLSFCSCKPKAPLFLLTRCLGSLVQASAGCRAIVEGGSGSAAAPGAGNRPSSWVCWSWSLGLELGSFLGEKGRLLEKQKLLCEDIKDIGRLQETSSATDDGHSLGPTPSREQEETAPDPVSGTSMVEGATHPIRCSAISRLIALFLKIFAFILDL